MNRFRITLLISLFAVIAAVVLLILRAGSNTITTPSTSPIPTPTTVEQSNKVKTISFDGIKYAYAYFIIQNPSNLLLIPNYSHPKDTESLMVDNGCISAINGGFYDKDNKPLGHFQSAGKVISAQIKSDLVNGYVWANASGSAVISSQLPSADYNFALQTGPMLLFDGKALPLAIHNDTHARRMIAAKDEKLIFLSIYNEESVYEGPLLADLPLITKSISTKENLNIMDAINLDGGSASAFYNGETKLSEITPVGSLFCVK